MYEKIKTKRCTKCGKVKLVSEFYKDKKGRPKSWCKECARSHRKKYRENNKEKVKEINKKSYLKHRKNIRIIVGKVEIRCGQCGKYFLEWPSSHRKYCSHECYGKSHTGENNGFFGKHHTEELKEKSRIRASNHKDSEETKNKKRIANLKRYEDPKERERTSEANKKRFSDPNQREIQRINQLKAFEKNPAFKESSIQTLKHIVKTPEHKRNIGLALRGEKNGCWKGGITKLDVQIRSCTKMKLWRLGVLKRDNYADAFSGVKGTPENPVDVHHYIKFSILMEKYDIKSLEEAEACEELWDLDNGVTILKSTHDKHHYKWGL